MLSEMVLSYPSLWALGVHALLLVPYCIHGEIQNSFKEGERVPMFVNRLSSTMTQLPKDYYRLPFCQPEHGQDRVPHNIGQDLSGYSIKTSPYEIYMKKDMYCEILCRSNLGRRDYRGVIPTKTVKAIRQRYHHNWILDNIPSASRDEDDAIVTTRYWHGFPVGFTNSNNHKSYIHNHVNIHVQYQDIGGSYQVTRFTVQPFSIEHDFELSLTPPQHAAGWFLPRTAQLNNPIASCNPNIASQQHTNYDMITHTNHNPQEASGDVLFTYDVIWSENKVNSWSSRWDIYTTMDKAIPGQVHVFPIINSAVYLSVLVALVIVILRRFVSHNINDEREAGLTEEEVSDSLRDKGYSLVHISHFDPPEGRSLWILSLFCGTGAQLLLTTMLTIATAAMGFLHSSASGRLVMFQLIAFAVTGFCNGFVSVQTSKLCGGDVDWKRMALASSMLFPGLTFALLLSQQIVAAANQSTLAIPLSTHVVLLGFWLCVNCPLAYAGAYLGDRMEPFQLPKAPRSILLGFVNYRAFRQGDWKAKCCFVLFGVLLNFSLIAVALLWLIRVCLVKQNLWRPSFNGVFGILLGGVIVFGSVFVEIYYTLSSFWLEYYYATFGFLALVSVIFFLSCGAVSVLFSFTQLTVEDSYSWWWQFHCGGAAGFWLLLYSLLYLRQLELVTFSSVLLFSGYMIWLSLAMYLMSGFVGMVSSVWFVKKIFSIAKAGESMVSATHDVELTSTTEVAKCDVSPPDADAEPDVVAGTMT